MNRLGSCGGAPTIAALLAALLAITVTGVASPAINGTVALLLVIGLFRSAGHRSLEWWNPAPVGTLDRGVWPATGRETTHPNRTGGESRPSSWPALEWSVRASSFSDRGRGPDRGDESRRDENRRDDGNEDEGTTRSRDRRPRSATELTRAEARNILGVSLMADENEIRAAYRDRVKAVHPDTGGDRAAFMRVTAAYERLTDNSSH